MPSSSSRIPFNQHDFRILVAGLSWEDGRPRGNVLQSMGLAKSSDFDVDLMAILLGPDGKIQNLGHVRDYGGGNRVGLWGGDVVSYLNVRHPSSSVWLGANMPSWGSRGDIEQVFIEPAMLPKTVDSILLIASVRQAFIQTHDLSHVKNLRLSLSDAQDDLLFTWSPETHAQQQVACMELVRLFKDAEGFIVAPIFKPAGNQTFVELVRDYI